MKNKLCEWYQLTKKDNFCLCHLADGRVFDCQYKGNWKICHKPDRLAEIEELKSENKKLKEQLGRVNYLNIKKIIRKVMLDNRHLFPENTLFAEQTVMPQLAQAIVDEIKGGGE